MINVETVNVGTVMEVYENEALVMTADINLIHVKRNPKMFLGQQICFTESDVIKPGARKLKYILTSGIAAVFMVTLIAIYFIQNISTSPQDISYAFIDMDINPSIGFFIDDTNTVQEVLPLNSDAENLTKVLSLEDLPVKEAVKKVIDMSEETGILNADEDSVIMFSASLNPENGDYKTDKDHLDLKLNQLLASLSVIDSSKTNRPFTIKVVKVEPEVKKQALENNLSSGRQFIFQKAQTEGINLTLDEAKLDSLTSLIKKVGLDEQNTDKGPLSSPTKPTEPAQKGTTSPAVTNSPTPTPTSNIIQPTATKTPAVPADTETSPSSTPTTSDGVETSPTSTPAASGGVKTSSASTPSASGGVGTSPSGTSSAPADAIKIQYYSNSPQKSDIIQVNSVFKVINTGNTAIDLKDVTLRYYYTIDSENPQFLDYWAQEGESRITHRFVKMSQPVEKADYYLEIGFLTGQLNPGQETVVVTWFNKEDWSIYNQKDDYSYNYSDIKTYYDWKCVTGYISGDLKWGIEPAD